MRNRRGNSTASALMGVMLSSMVVVSTLTIFSGGMNTASDSMRLSREIIIMKSLTKEFYTDIHTATSCEIGSNGNELILYIEGGQEISYLLEDKRLKKNNEEYIYAGEGSHFSFEGNRVSATIEAYNGKKIILSARIVE